MKTGRDHQKYRGGGTETQRGGLSWCVVGVIKIRSGIIRAVYTGVGNKNRKGSSKIHGRGTETQGGGAPGVSWRGFGGAE